MVVPEASINNIMGGLESTAGVRLHNHRRKLKQRFDIVRKLGQGTYGKVQLGINKETGQEVAIKTIKKCKIETEADLIRIRREIQIMSSVQHPNIIHIYEVFENREKMVLVMEYAAGGELYDYISEKKVLNEAEARRIFRQIATAVYYCHKHKICHRDLKLENVLLDEHGSAKIADFGLSNVFDETHLLGTFCGSPLYASPEIVKGTPYHGPEVDCWSLGVLLYTLVYGSMPFDGSNFKRLVRQISQGDYFEPKKPSPASPLIAEMLKVNSARRADIVAICSHWWIDSGEAVPCLEVAEELANQTPVRLDLLLSLAPSACAGASDKLLIPEQEEEAGPLECPVRSQSLGSLAVTQPIDFLAEEAQRSKKRSKSKRRERSSSRNRKRDESTPESDSYTEKPHRKSSKSKKKQQKIEEPTQKMDESSTTVADESMADVKKEDKMSEDIKTSEVAEILQTISQLEKDYKEGDAAIEKGEFSLDDYKMETAVEDGEKEKKEEKKEEEKTNEVEKEALFYEKEPEKEEPHPPAEAPPKPDTKKEAAAKVVDDKKSDDKKTDDKKPEDDKPKPSMERRKSKIFETAEKFCQLQQESSVKPPPKKVFLPGVKVSDAKKAYERKSSLATSRDSVVRPASRRNSAAESLSRRGSVADCGDFDRKFSLASTVALNKLVEDADENKEAKQSKEETVKPVLEEKKSADKIVGDVKAKPKASTPEKAKEKSVSPPADNTIQVKKIQNAVQVIGNAIDSNNGEKKAATLPRRKTSRAEIKLTTPKVAKPEFRSEVEHMVAAATPPAATTVQRSEVVFPVAAAAAVVPQSSSGNFAAMQQSISGNFAASGNVAAVAHPVRSKTLPPKQQEGAPREHIIPIRFEAGDEKPPPVAAKVAKEQRPVSRTNSKSLSRQSTADSDSGSVVSQGEPIRKSPREVIIPIAVEGGGFVTPNLEAVNRMRYQISEKFFLRMKLFDSSSFAQRRKDVISRLSPDSLLGRDSWIGDKKKPGHLAFPGYSITTRCLKTHQVSPAVACRRRGSSTAPTCRGDAMSRDSSSTLPRDFSTRSSTLRPSLLHSRSIEPGSSSKLPRRSTSLSLRQADDKPPVYRQKFPRNLVPETSAGALDESTTNSKSADNRYSLQEKQVVSEGGIGYSNNLQEKQVVNDGSRGNLQEKQAVNDGSRGKTYCK
ncbi:hypothetical protein LSTR_LSTR007089 [Laodelphax striatellus]|uniref:Protein kinase domain-containing protein n=1 Tax=Laodelphax striatellus TaxID=195883 RepID=A0A482WFP2_LAOST|nr:hypothetical protein LSTR_LSTR007089 [Laodelphax striatellus]